MALYAAFAPLMQEPHGITHTITTILPLLSAVNRFLLVLLQSVAVQSVAVVCAKDALVASISDAAINSFFIVVVFLCECYANDYLMPFSFIPQTGHVPGLSYVFSCSHFMGHWYLLNFSSPQDESANTLTSVATMTRINKFMLLCCI
jgi:hypothetical protein